MNLTLREQERIAYANGDTAALQALALAEEAAEEAEYELESAEIRRLESDLDDANGEALEQENRRIALAEAVEQISIRLSDFGGQSLTREQIDELAELLRDVQNERISGLDAALSRILP